LNDLLELISEDELIIIMEKPIISTQCMKRRLRKLTDLRHKK
jgi:hypothetical protein